jgi:ribosome-binding protein aMBF1 (putative translation factor)
MTMPKKRDRKAKLVPAADVFATWREERGYSEAYDALEEEFEIMSALIKARSAAGLSQDDVAKRMKTTQSAVARLEGRAHRASLATLKSYATATGHRLKITFEPVGQKR